jgi:4-hydroxybenzoate polyprenyltransferase
MASVKAFFRLIRLPNLMFIVLAQFLFQYCIYYSIYKGQISDIDTRQFLLLVLASVFIAAAGNIINDYFDINIDIINKPGKVVLGRIISRRWALAWHFILSGLGILITALAVNPFSRWYLVIANMGCVVLLFFYSMRFKRDVLIGNIIISLLTAWTIMLIFLSKFSFADAFVNVAFQQVKFFRFAVLYSGFAFVISLIREAVKDIEDLPGDMKYNCRTMPVAWGRNATKVYTAVWLTILIISLIIIQIYVLQFQWWWAMGYCLLFTIFPLIYIFKKLIAAQKTSEYHDLSTLIKLVMLTGILSMMFFYIYL